MIKRPRRLRHNPNIRQLVRGMRISQDSLIYPIFIREGEGIKEEITSMPGQFRYSIDEAVRKVNELILKKISAVMIFGIPDVKDETGSSAYDDNGIVQRAVRELRKVFPDLLIITDVCLCEYTSHGHCGVVHGSSNCPERYDVDNDKTLELLAATSLSHVRAGADMIAPSDMMDGRIGAIRQALDDNGYKDIPIMAYSVKYASAFYSPFRDAAGSAPKFGDRRSYQMDFTGRREALREVSLDIDEGADIVMVKPALSYLDIIRDVSEVSEVPVAAYSVSGEYAMLMASDAAGVIDLDKILTEMTIAVYRAGADILITYFAERISDLIDEGRL